MGGLFQINPIWNFGPYNPAHISAGSQPDWYVLFTEGMLRIFPPWDIYLGDYNIPPAFWASPAFLPVLYTIAGAYPWIEKRFTKDNALHNLLQRPRDVPVRTSLGVMGISFYTVLVLSRQQRHHRLLLRHLAQRHHLGGPHRGARGAADRLLGHLPDLHRAAALRPRGARTRHRDRHHQAAAARRVHRGAPAAGRRRRPRPRDPAGVPGRPGAQADEPARHGRRAGARLDAHARPGRADRGPGAGPPPRRPSWRPPPATGNSPARPNARPAPRSGKHSASSKQRRPERAPPRNAAGPSPFPGPLTHQLWCSHPNCSPCDTWCATAAPPSTHPLAHQLRRWHRNCSRCVSTTLGVRASRGRR